MTRHYLNLDDRAWRAARVGVPARNIALADRLRYGAVSAWLTVVEQALPETQEWPAAVPPVFILGHWRSGTTLLHELLCATGLFAFPTTYACMNPQAFLLSRGRGSPPAKAGLRPMDAMTIGSDLPQEDEFALFCLGAPSPYEALLFPGRLAVMARRANPLSWSAEEMAHWQRTFLRFCSAAQVAAPNKPLLLKSPSHSFRIDHLARLLPGARFIFLTRHPHDVFASTQNLWRSLWQLYALCPPTSGAATDRWIAETMAELDAAAEAARETDILSFRFEDLIANPGPVLQAILAGLGLPAAGMDAAAPRIAAMPGYVRQSHTLSDDNRALLRKYCARPFARHGYDDRP